MKEQEPIVNKVRNELTNIPNSSTLEEERNIFMEENGDGQSPHETRQQGPQKGEVKSKEEAIREAWDRAMPVDDSTPQDVRSTRQQAIDAGFMPGLTQEQNETVGIMWGGQRGDDDALETIANRLGITAGELMRFRRERLKEKPDIYSYDVEGLSDYLRTRGEAAKQQATESSGGGKGNEPPRHTTGGGQESGGNGDEGGSGEEPNLKETAKEKLIEEARSQALKTLVGQVMRGELTMDEASDKFAAVLGTEEKQMEQAMREFRGRVAPDEMASDAFDKIAGATEIGQARSAFGVLLAQAREVQRSVGKGNFAIDDDAKQWYDATKQFISDFDSGNIDPKDLTAVQKAASELKRLGHEEAFNRFLNDRREKGLITQPEGLEDLIGLIMNSDNPEWNVGGSRELQNEKGEIQMHNFMAWIRDRIMYNHEFNVDSQINLFGEMIYIPTPYRQISLGEIISTHRYFRKENKQNGKWEKNEHYDNLRDQILYEVWLFQNSHNFDVEYRLNMGGNEEKCVESMIKIHGLNIFTKDKNRLFNILTLPSIDQVDKTITEGDRSEASVGQAIRRALLAYNYLYEIGLDPNTEEGNMFEKVLGENGTLEFYRAVASKLIKDKFGDEFGDIIEDVNQRNKDNNGEEKKLSDPTRKDLIETLLESDEVDFITVLQRGYLSDNPALNTRLMDALIAYRESGMKDAQALKRFVGELMAKTHVVEVKDVTKATGVDELNIFNKFGKQYYIQELLREGMRNAVGRAQDLTSADLRYAEHWAFSMTYWSAISARNDVDALGFDGLSKIMNFRDYRIRQAEGRGGYGDLDTIYTMKKLALTMWEGLRVVDEKTGVEKTYLEMLQGGRGDRVDIDTRLDPYRSSDGSMEVSLAAQHYPNVLGMYKFLMTEHGLNFDKFLHRDNLGRLVIDYKEADIIRRDYIKWQRYGWDMPGFMYDREFRSWYRDSDGKLRVTNAPLQEFLFHEKVLNMDMYDLQRRSGKRDRPIYLHAYRARTDEDGKIRDVSGRLVTKQDEQHYLYEDGTNANLEDVLVLQNMSRNIVADGFATELWMHRNYLSGRRIYALEEFDMIEQYLRTLPLEITEGREGRGTLLTPYFSGKEFAKIRKEGHVDPTRLEWENFGLRSAYSAGGALLEMLRELSKRVAA